MENISTNCINNLTCISVYWKIKNKHGNNFNNWFNTTLKINCPYIFFGDIETIELVKCYRLGLPTYYIPLNLEEFKINPFSSDYFCWIDA